MSSANLDPLPYDDEDEDVYAPALTAQQAEAFRVAHPTLSPWRVIGAQAGSGAVVAGLVGWWFNVLAGVSVACGVVSVALPAALFARGISRPAARLNAATAVGRFLVWELAKLGLTAALLFAAFHWVDGLNGLALLAGLVVAMKVYWLALLWRH